MDAVLRKQILTLDPIPETAPKPVGDDRKRDQEVTVWEIGNERRQKLRLVRG